MEKNNEFYDSVYLDGGSKKIYHKHYTKSIYFPIWKKTIEQLEKVKNPIILDLGCGVGQFANYLFDEGYTNYTGIDFSKEGIVMAQSINKKQKEKFKIENLYKTDIYNSNYNVVFLLEVLEHLDKDIDVIKKLKTDSVVFLSVPNFNSNSHVRYFKDIKSIVDRYHHYLDFIHISTYNMNNINKIFLCECIKK